MLERSAKELIKLFKTANILLTDSVTGKDIDYNILKEIRNFILYETDEEKVLYELENIYFKNAIDKCSNQTPFEVYGQYKKILKKDDRKLMIFLVKFNIIDKEEFISIYKKTDSYPKEFYDKDLRSEILEEQNNKCACCSCDLDGIYPHLHHIDYNKKNCLKINLAFLCPRCHGKTGTNREFWCSMLKVEKETHNKLILHN